MSAWIRSNLRASCVVALLAILASACSPATAPAVVQQLPTADESAAVLPIGRFKDVSLPRLLVLSIHNDLTFEVFLDGDRIDTGIFVFTGSQVKVDSMKCDSAKIAPGHYNWLYAEGELTFQAAAPDRCSDRRQYLSDPFEPQYLFIFEPASSFPTTE